MRIFSMDPKAFDVWGASYRVSILPGGGEVKVEFSSPEIELTLAGKALDSRGLSVGYKLLKEGDVVTPLTSLHFFPPHSCTILPHPKPCFRSVMGHSRYVEQPA